MKATIVINPKLHLARVLTGPTTLHSTPKYAVANLEYHQLLPGKYMLDKMSFVESPEKEIDLHKICPRCAMAITQALETYHETI